MKKTSHIKYVAALYLSVFFLFCSASIVKADYVEDEVNGVSYTNKVYISKGYASHNAYGGDSYIQITLNDTTDRVTNVRSSSKNLLAKKTSEFVWTATNNYYDETLGQDVQITHTSYDSIYISFFGKKKGTYTVKFDVVDKSGVKKCTKKIKVYVDKWPSTPSAIKSITYAGKALFEHEPFTKVTSGKIKVKLNKGYSLVSIKVKKLNSKGEWKTTKVKNGKKISLAKTSKYTQSDADFSWMNNPLFPETQLLITVKDKKTKEKWTEEIHIYTMNKK